MSLSPPSKRRRQGLNNLIRKHLNNLYSIFTFERSSTRGLIDLREGVGGGGREGGGEGVYEEVMGVNEMKKRRRDTISIGY